MLKSIQSLILLFGFLFTVTSCSSINHRSNFSDAEHPPMPHEPGKCYAKVLLPNAVNESEIILPVYTGDDAEYSLDVEIRKVILEHGSEAKWVKKKADRNCLSADPEDCLVWCLVSTPEVAEFYEIVTDTTSNKAFELTRIVTRKREGGETDWAEIVCENDIDDNLYTDIAMLLIGKGFLKENEAIDYFSPEMKAALAQYQRNNGLASGALTIESLIHMGLYVE